MKINYQNLKDQLVTVFIAYGATKQNARLVSEYLVDSDLVGHASHGVARAPLYLERIKKGNEMNKYRFDWKDVIHGTIEIDAQCGNDAEEILMNMSLRDLLKNSQFNSDKKEREIRFADAGLHFQSLDKDDWNKLKENL